MKMLESSRKNFNYLEVKEFLEDIFFHLSDHNENVFNNKTIDLDKKLFDTTNYEKRNELLGRCRKILNNLDIFFIDEQKTKAGNSLVKKPSIKNNDDLPYLNMSAGKKASIKKTKPPPPPQLPQLLHPPPEQQIVSDYVDVMNLNSDSENDEGISEPDSTTINTNHNLNDLFDNKVNIKSKDDDNIYDRCSVNTLPNAPSATNPIIQLSSATIVTLASDQSNCPFSGLPAAHLEIKQVQKCGYLLKIERRLFFGQKKNYYAGILDGWLLLYSGGKTDLKPSICLNLINCSVQLTNLPPTPPVSTAFVANTTLSTPIVVDASGSLIASVMPLSETLPPPPPPPPILVPTISVTPPTTNIKTKRDLEFFIQLNIDSTVTTTSTSSTSSTNTTTATTASMVPDNRRKRYRFQVTNQIDHTEWMNEIQKYSGNLTKNIIEIRQTCSSFSRKLPTPPTSATEEQLPILTTQQQSLTIQSASDLTNSTDYENRSIINNYNKRSSQQQIIIDDKLLLKTESIYEEPNEMLNYSIDSIPKIIINNSNELNKYSTIDYGRQFNYDIPKSPPKCVDENQRCHDDEKLSTVTLTNQAKLSVPSTISQVTSSSSTSTSPSSTLTSPTSPSSSSSSQLMKQKKNDKFKDMQSILSTQLTVVSTRSSPSSQQQHQQQEHQQQEQQPQEPPPPKKTKSNKSWFRSRLTILSSNNSNLDNSSCKTKATTNDNNKNSVKISKKPVRPSSPTMTTPTTTQQIKINATKTGGKINMIINQLEANGHLSHFQKSNCGGGGGGGNKTAANSGSRRNHKDDHNYEAVEISKK